MIPNYTLYGEENDELFPDILHCESIAARSTRHDWSIAPHRHHRLHQFFLLRTGGGKITIEGDGHNVTPAVVISMPPLTVHGFEFVRNTRGWVVTMPVSVFKEILPHAPDIRNSLLKPVILQATQKIISCFEQISVEHQGGEPGRRQLLIHMAGMLAIEVGRAATDFAPVKNVAESRGDILVRNFLQLLEKKYKSHHSVAEYAGLLGLTAPHLTRTCQQVVGKSTSDLIQDRLILEAKRSLVYTRMSVSELAYSLGFSDPAHFSKFFQRRTDHSPSKFREKADPQF